MSRIQEYRDFLMTKIKMAHMAGVPCEMKDIHPILKPHQRDIVKWAVEGGQRAIFAAFGLGKTLMQLEIMRLLGGRTLIVCPLGVRQEFKRDAGLIGTSVEFVRRTAEVEESDAQHFITNYESVRDGKLDVSLFNAISLDEASVLRSYGSKTFQEFLPLCAPVKYKFVATATPSPNRYKELIHYAGFLGVMDTGDALTRFFQRDSQKANNLTLYPHKEKEFWTWMHSWAVFLQKPSELGYSDEGYDLPELKVFYHQVKREGEKPVGRDNQIHMFHEAALGLKESATEKRETINARIEKMVEILESDPDSHYLLWHDFEAERHAIKKAVPDAVEVYGSLDLDLREERVIDFSEGRSKYLATKPEISGSGCNFQRHCHKAIFLGIGYKFNDFIQSIHRIHRFLQPHACEIHVIYSESESEVLRVLLQKWEEYKKLTAHMSTIISEHGLYGLSIEPLLRDMGVQRKVEHGEGWEVALNDCVEEAALQKDNSVGLIVSSIPFSNHYEYTPNYNDYGHTANNDEFWRQMDFLTPELLRILQPGRMACIHVKDRILFGNVTGAGAPTVSPFHAEAIFHYSRHGFDYMGMITVITDVVRENNQTYRLGWTENGKDGTKMGVGSPEYVLLFRKPQTDRTRGYADVPVVKPKNEYTRARWQVDAHAFWRSSGDRLLRSEEFTSMNVKELVQNFRNRTRGEVYDYEEHVKIGESFESRKSLPATFMAIAPGSWAEDVWDDVNRMLTLNSEQVRRNLVMHVCPLQIDIVDRLIVRYSNEGELVYDPFGGIMTVPYRAVLLNRRGGGSELNESYFRDGVRHLRIADAEKSALTLFDDADIGIGHGMELRPVGGCNTEGAGYE